MKALLLAALTVLALPAVSLAGHGGFSLSIGFGGGWGHRDCGYSDRTCYAPRVYAPAYGYTTYSCPPPVCYDPTPVAYCAPPVVYQQAPVYYAPAVTYVAPTVVYTQPTVVYSAPVYSTPVYSSYTYSYYAR